MCKFFLFLQFFFFLVLPTVEGPHSDTLSRTRFSVFLRILFGVSSSSRTPFILAEMFDSRLRPEACSGNPFFILIWRGFKPHTRKQGQFMSATRLGIVSSTTKFIFLHDSLRLRKFISLVYSIPLTARGPFPYNRPAELCVFLLPYGSLFKK